MTFSTFPDFGPMTQVTPFTHRDNATYLSILQNLIQFINVTLGNEMNDEIQHFLDLFNAEVVKVEGEINVFEANVNGQITAFEGTTNAALAAFEASTNAAMTAFEANVNGQITTFEGTTNASITTFENTVNAAIAAFEANINTQVAGINAVPYWQANRAYTAGTIVFNPVTGDPVIALVDNNRAVYTPADWKLSPNFVQTGKQFITPEMYGAKGDGVTDDSAALQNAVNAGATAGLPVWMNAAKYLLAATSWLNVPSGSRLFGLATISGTVSGAALMKVNSNVSIEGLTIINNGVGGRMNIYIQPNAVNVKLMNLKFTPAVDNSCVGIQASEAGIKNVRIVNCDFDGQSYGVLTNSGGTTAAPTGAWDIADVQVCNNRFANMWADPIEFNHPFNSACDGTRSSATGFVVSGNVIHAPNGAGPSAGLGVGMAGVNDVTVMGNTITARTQGIHVEDDSTNIAIIGNIIANVKGASAYAGIAILPSCRDIVISGNTIHDIGDTTTCNGIDVGFSAVTVHAKNIVIAGNTVRQVTGVGISVAANAGLGGFFRVSGNVIRNCGGNGLNVLGTPDNVEAHNNTIDTVAGYGVFVTSYNSGIRVSSNTITAATTGDYNGNLIASQNGTFLRDRTAHFDPSPGSLASALAVPLFRLGSYADGVVHVNGQCIDSPGTRIDFVARVRWDGATLTYNRSLSNINGVIGGGALSMVNGVLTFTVGARPDGSTLRGQATFTGAIMETGQVFSTTVAGTMTNATPVAAVDAATTQALVNDLRQKLINLGLVS